MEKENFKKYLTKLSIPQDSWIRLPELNYIILESDANQFYNPLMEKIKFDTSSGLIRLKHSPLKSISSPVKQFSYNKTHKTIFIQNGFSSVYSYKKMREPKVGDYFCAFCPETDTMITSSPITEIRIRESGTQLILLNDTIFNKIEIEKKPMQFFIVLQGVNHFVELNNPAELYEEPETDDSFSDIYIDIDRIIGFEFDMKWRPNNV